MELEGSLPHSQVPANCHSEMEAHVTVIRWLSFYGEELL